MQTRTAHEYTSKPLSPCQSTPGLLFTTYTLSARLKAQQTRANYCPMRDLIDILSAVRDFDARKTPYAVATVVNVSGSSYRRPGARMFLAGSETVGAISGGCLEADVAEHAKQVITTGEPLVVHYDTSFENDSIMGLGIGCDGLIDVLIERLPLPATAPCYTSFLAQCVARHEIGVLATVFAVSGAKARVGSRLILQRDGTTSDDIANEALRTAILTDAQSALASGKPLVPAYVFGSATVDVLIEVVRPPLPLFVFGAGHDAMPLAALATILGWEVTVVDPRASFANTANFPSANRVVACHPEALREHVELAAPAVAVVMTHKFEWDKELTRQLIASPVRYIGLLGPRKRSERILSMLTDDGALPDDRRGFVRFPVGLDIGAETPEEVAMSIIAEIQAFVRDRAGGFLKDRDAPIH